jgi:hypothetical protein
MKHAGPEALDRLEHLLAKLRTIKTLKERSRGIFYRSGRAFLHFHEHGSELFADMRMAEDFQRFPATSPTQRTALIRVLKDALRE